LKGLARCGGWSAGEHECHQVNQIGNVGCGAATAIDIGLAHARWSRSAAEHERNQVYQVGNVRPGSTVVDIGAKQATKAVAGIADAVQIGVGLSGIEGRRAVVIAAGYGSDTVPATTVDGALDDAIAVDIDLGRGEGEVAVVVDTVAQFRGAGVDGVVGVIAVDVEDRLARIAAIEIGAGDGGNRAETVTIRIGVTDLAAVTVLVDAVADYFGCARIHRGVVVVAVIGNCCLTKIKAVEVGAEDGRKTAETIIVVVGVAKFATVAVLVDAVTDYLRCTGEDAGVAVIAVTIGPGLAGVVAVHICAGNRREVAKAVVVVVGVAELATVAVLVDAITDDFGCDGAYRVVIVVAVEVVG